MKFAKPTWFNLPKSPWKNLPNFESISALSSDDTDEQFGENFEDSWRVSLSKKMPSPSYLSMKKSENNESRRKSHNYIPDHNPFMNSDLKKCDSSDDSSTKVPGTCTFINHWKAEQELIDTKNLFSNAVKNKPSKLKSVEAKYNRKFKTNRYNSFKNMNCVTPSSMSSTTSLVSHSKSKKGKSNTSVYNYHVQTEKRRGKAGYKEHKMPRAVAHRK